MDNQVVAQALTLTLIGVGTAFVLLIALMLSIKIMSYILVKFISRPMTKTNEIDSSLDIDTHELPQHLQLKSIYPNPFNPIINIEYELPASASIQFGIYNIKGQKIDRIKEGYKSPGFYSIIWNGKNHPSGIYFIVMENESKSLIKKIVLLK